MILLVRTVLAEMGPHEPFGPIGVHAEVDRRFGSGLRSRIEVRQIGDILRRLPPGPIRANPGSPGEGCTQIHSGAGGQSRLGLLFS